MADTNISWADKVWNPITGCTKVSAGCANCYAEAITKRFSPKDSFNEIVIHMDRLDIPRHWKKPSNIFVNSMSDLFHKDVPRNVLKDINGVFMDCPQHIFMILTKRIERAMEYFNTDPPPPNVWLGVSVENNATLNRVEVLSKIKVSKRFISLEPLLEQVDIEKFLPHWACQVCGEKVFHHELDLENQLCTPGCRSKWGIERGHNSTGKIDWVILGAESGVERRPFEVDWAIHTQIQCERVGTPLFIKQDSGPYPGMQGRIPDWLWKIKEFPGQGT